MLNFLQLIQSFVRLMYLEERKIATKVRLIAKHNMFRAQYLLETWKL